MYEETTCKYFHKIKRCRRGSKCWFYHNKTLKVDNESITLKQISSKKFKEDQNVDKEPKQELCSNLKQEILGLVKLLLREKQYLSIHRIGL